MTLPAGQDLDSGLGTDARELLLRIAPGASCDMPAGQGCREVLATRNPRTDAPMFAKVFEPIEDACKVRQRIAIIRSPKSRRDRCEPGTTLMHVDPRLTRTLSKLTPQSLELTTHFLRQAPKDPQKNLWNLDRGTCTPQSMRRSQKLS